MLDQEVLGRVVFDQEASALMGLVQEVPRQEELDWEESGQGGLVQEVSLQEMLGRMVLVQEVRVQEELGRAVLGLEELRRVVLVQKAVPGQVVPVQEEREAPGKVILAQEKGKAARTLGVVGEESKVIVAMTLASMLALQLQYHGTLHYFQNSIPYHRQRLVVEMVLRSTTLSLMIAEEVQFVAWCLVSPALRYKLATLP